MYNNISPGYLSSLIPQQVDAISRYKLRNSNDLQTIRAKTSLYYNSFLLSTLRQWNNLSIETRQLNSHNSFKCFLKEDKRTVPKCYFYGVRKAQILHTRLRMLQFTKFGPLYEEYHGLANVVALKTHSISFFTATFIKDNVPYS